MKDSDTSSDDGQKSYDEEEKIEHGNSHNAIAETIIFEEMNLYPPEYPKTSKFLFGVEIIPKLMASLNPKVYIEDCIINVFLSLLSAHVDKCRGLKVLAFPTFMVTSLMDTDVFMNYAGWAKITQTWDQRVWLLPVNLSDSHWTLLIVLPDMNVIIYCDSSHKDIPLELLKGLFSFMEIMTNDQDRKHKNKKINPDTWNIYRPLDVPRQTLRDGNCGAHIMSWAYVLCTSLVFKFTERNMLAVRRGVASVSYGSTTSAEQDGKVTMETRVLTSEPRVRIHHEKDQEFVVQRKPPNQQGTLEYIASLAYNLYENKKKKQRILYLRVQINRVLFRTKKKINTRWKEKL